jgi:hypothetical protein
MMTEATTTVAPPVAADAERPLDGEKRKYARSEIRFPYTDIGDAVTVAATVHRNHGSSCTVDQLAADFGQTTRSGAFRNKIASAQTFGAVIVSKQTVALTDLGRRLADEQTRPRALVESFLSVPLYERIYKQYQGGTLPGDAGLESEIRAQGVVPNQAERARQVLQRSAQKAGFFSRGRDRLVEPSGATLGPAQPQANNAGAGGADGEVTRLSDSPLLKALWDTLPAEAPFTAEGRRRFFTTLAFNIDYVYGPPTGGKLDPNAIANLWKVEENPSSQTAADGAEPQSAPH